MLRVFCTTFCVLVQNEEFHETFEKFDFFGNGEYKKNNADHHSNGEVAQINELETFSARLESEYKYKIVNPESLIFLIPREEEYG